MNLGASKPSANTGSLLTPGCTSAYPHFKNVVMKRFCKPSDEGNIVIKTEIRCLYWAALLLRIFVPIFGTKPILATRAAWTLLYSSLQYCHLPAFPCCEMCLRHQQKCMGHFSPSCSYDTIKHSKKRCIFFSLSNCYLHWESAEIKFKSREKTKPEQKVSMLNCVITCPQNSFVIKKSK